MEHSENFITSSSEETQKLGERFGQKLQRGDVVCLYGDLGSGKTTFVKGIAKGLGIASRIISPTFVLIRQYKVRITNNPLAKLYHIDLYRLEDEHSIKNVGLEELLEEQNAIVVIEWAEKLGDMLPKKRWDVQFELEDENLRKISIGREGA